MSSNNNSKLEEIVKKIQDGNTSFLLIAGFFLIIPVVAILVLTSGPKGGKKISQEKIKSMAQRKNVFNFGTKSENGVTSAPRSGNSSNASNWFSSRTEEQVTRDEINDAKKIIEKSMQNVRAPMELEPEARQQYEAEHNYNLCMANGAIEEGQLDLAEDFLKKALDDAKNNPFLLAYTYASLCNLYEITGDKQKLEEAYKAYFEAITNLPKGYGGDLKSTVRNAYQSLQALANSADPSKVSEAISNSPLVKSGDFSGDIDLKSIYQNFPVKYE